MSGSRSFHFFRSRPDSFSKAAKKMKELIDQNLAHWDLDKLGRETLRWILGTRDTPGRRRYGNIASNIAARRAAAGRFRREFNRYLEAHPDCRFRHVTIVGDAFRTKDRDTEVQLESLKRLVGQLIPRGVATGWVGVVEIQAESRSYPGEGRALLLHIHIILWSNDPGFDFDALEQKLAASPRLSCSLGAPTVKITGGNSHDAMPLRDRRKLARRWIRYLFKLPAFAKNLVPQRENPQRLRYYGSNLRPNLALRLTEVLSRMRVDELIMGSGDGRAMATEVKKHIREIARNQHTAPDDQDIARFWENARRANGKDNYRPVIVNRWKNNARTMGYTRGMYNKTPDS